MKTPAHSVARLGLAFLVIHFFASSLLFGQADTDLGREPEPVYSVEGEEALSTNFAPQAVLLYGASGNRTLQLNEANAYGDLPYYADYVIAPPEEGRYTIWYGGSIPGARDPLAASYGSPIEIGLNETEPQRLYWEDVEVGEVYSPPYSWIKTATVQLDAGVHTLRITVPEPRRYDDRYFFYIDRLLLLPEGQSPEGAGELRTEPESIEDYLIELKEDPTNLAAYERLIFFYSLLGDHLNAIRYANRALSVSENASEILRLLARNTVWNGDISGGLNSYWRLLSAAPEDSSGYLEAGKIAAWNGFFGASEQFFQAGLRVEEEHLGLITNLGFTYLWWNREADARQQFRQAERLADNPAAIMELAEIFLRNDAPDRAEQSYRRGIEAFPDSPELYVALIELLYQHDRAEEVSQLIASAPEEAAEALERLELEIEERESLIAEYREEASEYPLDVARRRVLAQTYFWNGDVATGIREYEKILGVEVSGTLARLAVERASLFEALTFLIAVDRRVRESLGEVGSLYEGLQEQLSDYQSAVEDEAENQQELFSALAETVGRAEALAAVSGRMQRIYEGSRGALENATDGEREALAEQQGALLTGIGSEALLAQIEEEVERSRELGFRRGRITGAELSLLQEPTAVLTENGFEPEDALVPGDRYYQLLYLVGQSPDDALELLEQLQGEGERTPLQDSFVSFMVLSREESADPGLRPATVAREVERLSQDLLRREEQLALLQQDIRNRRADLAERLRLRGEVALVEVEQGRLSFRIQLGNLLSDSGDIGSAIGQYERVLAFDPSNLEAKYALANLYRRDGRWAVAKEQLREIYRIDPAYRNTVGIYNEISAAHADTLVTSLFTEAESQRAALGARLSYTWQISSRAAFETEVGLRNDRLRYESEEQLRRHAYQLGSLSLALPLTFREGSLAVRPQVGATTLANGLYLASLPEGTVTSTVDGADYFQNYAVRPMAGLSATLTAATTYTALSYRYGPYQQEFELPDKTIGADFENVTAHGVDGDFVIEPAEGGSPFLERLRLATAGEYDLLLLDGESLGSRYLAQQTVQLSLVERASPYSRLGIGLSSSWEDYLGEETDRIYTPSEVFQVGGAVDGRLYRPFGSDLTYGLIGRVYGGYYQPSIVEGGVDPATRFQAELGAELTRRNVAFQLNSIFNTTFTNPTDLDYYSFRLELLAVVRNFDVLSR